MNMTRQNIEVKYHNSWAVLSKNLRNMKAAIHLTKENRYRLIR
jgi:hypothetical protein